MQDDEILIDTAAVEDTATHAEARIDQDTSMEDEGGSSGARPSFPAVSASQEVVDEMRKVAVPSHRFTPLKENWEQICLPIVQHLKLQIRMNLKTRHVEIRTSEHTEDPGNLQKAEDFVRAFCLGFELDDSIALLRLDDLFIDTFDIKDVKQTIHGDHLSRAIGRIAGKGGRTKWNIENLTKTRIVLADSRIHLLGSFQNIKLARDAVVELIIGSPPGKVFARLQQICQRLSERT